MSGRRSAAAEGEDEPIVGQDLSAARRGQRHGLPRKVDADDLPFHAPDADGAEHVIERDPGPGQVRLVVAHADAVEGVAVDQAHLDGIRTVAELVELAGGTERAPEPGESAAQDEDSLGAHETPPPLGSKICSIEVPNTSAILNASGRLGSYLCFSIAFTVCRETPSRVHAPPFQRFIRFAATAK